MLGAIVCLLVVVLVCVRARAHVDAQVGIQFIGLTNNPGGLLGTSEKVLAVFSVTNRAASPIRDVGFYYIETLGLWRAYSPLGAGSPLGSGAQIEPHGSATILTRISTNGVPWRVVVPYSRTTPLSMIANGVRNGVDSALKRPQFDFDRYGSGAPRSDWVKP